MTRTKKLDSGIAVVFVMLVMVLLADSVSMAAIGDEMVVNEEVPNIRFPIAYFPSDTIPPAAVDYLPRDTTPPTVIEHTPTGENVPVTTEIIMTFSKQMDTESAEGAFSIYPEVSAGKFYWDDNTMIFAPGSDLNYDTRYVVELEGANALAGSSLSWHEWDFITEPLNNPPNTPRLSGPTSGYIGTVYSYSTFATDLDGDRITYTFDWGDGSTSKTEFVIPGDTVTPSHDWDEEGEYTVKVMATDAKGASSKWSEVVMAVASSPELISPAAILSASATEINAGEGIVFSAEASSDRDGEVVSYYWDFGDGDTDTRVNVEHVYPHSGHYTVTLTVTDNDKLSDTDTVDISVTIPTLSVSIFTNPVPSGESEEILVLVFSDGDTIDGADVSLVSTIGSLHPSEGKTDESGEFVSIYTAPPVSTTQRYTISATAEKEGYKEGINSVSDSIFVEQPPPTTPTPVVTPISTPKETPTPPPTPLPPIVPIAIAMIAAVTVLIYIFKKLLQYKEEKKKKIKEEEKQQRGAISASSDPEGSLVSLDGAPQGRSPLTMDNIPIGPHIVVFAKFGYFDCKREAVVTANQKKHVHCDLTEIPGIKLKLSAEPTEIPADGKSESKITIWLEDTNENKIPVPVEVTVELRTNRGKIERQVKILAGHASATATLTSSTDKGTATVEGKAEFLKGSTTVEFLHAT